MKNNSLRYISISHKSTSLNVRKRYHISNSEKAVWAEKIRSNFNDINGLLILVTCNRTEIYFESEMTRSHQIRDFISRQTVGSREDETKQLFSISDETADTVRHFLEVSSGLDSSILGDAEIIHQIKIAYQQSCQDHLQGSLLERCMQTVFKVHKRVSNETAFRDGTTSVAYKTLKLIAATFDNASRHSLKILVIGAGDIVKQLLNYNNKFGFSPVYVANRTYKRAEELTQKFGGNTYDWDRVLANDFTDFRVIITAVSNRPELVRKVGNQNEIKLLLDLAVPGNIDKQLVAQSNILHYDLDTIAKALKESQINRLKSVKQVDIIIQEELEEYLYWLKDAPYRKSLAQYKSEVNQWLDTYLQQHGHHMQEKAAKVSINRIVRRSIKQQGKIIPEHEMKMIVEEHL